MYKYLCPYCHTEVHKEDWEEYYKCPNCKRKTLYPNKIKVEEKSMDCYSCKNFYYDTFCSFQCPSCKKGFSLYNFCKVKDDLIALASVCKYYKNKEDN